MNLLQQFKNYLENQLANPEIEVDERPPFETVTAVREEGIELIAETERGCFTYDYNCYCDTGTTQLYEFELIGA